MKHIILVLLVLSSTVMCSAHKSKVLRGSGPSTTDVRTVGPFQSIDIEFPIRANITVKEGATQSLKFSGYANLIGHIRTKVSNGRLLIGVDLDEYSFRGDDFMVEATIVVPSLKELSMSGAATADFNGGISGHDLLLDLSGATSVSLHDVNLEKLDLDISGASEVHADGGNVRRGDYNLSGATKLNLGKMKTVEVKADLSGVARAELIATEKIKVDASGVSQLKYRGHPAKISQDVSGNAFVEALE